MEKRRKQVLAASFLAGAFAVTAGFAVQGHARAAQYRRMLDNTYQHAFTELATAAGELDVALRKVTYATSPELFSALCAQAYSKALAAQSALGELPYGNVELEQTAAFLAKTGDYAMALARDAYGETACTEAHRETLRGLAGAASTLSGALQSLLAELDAGTIRPEDVETVQARLQGGLYFLLWDGFRWTLPPLLRFGPVHDTIINKNNQISLEVSPCLRLFWTAASAAPSTNSSTAISGGRSRRAVSPPESACPPSGRWQPT